MDNHIQIFYCGQATDITNICLDKNVYQSTAYSMDYLNIPNINFKMFDMMEQIALNNENKIDTIYEVLQKQQH